nr:haloacid dehalogenase-like hydrolase family protein [Tanacetum cinerariifolium]
MRYHRLPIHLLLSNNLHSSSHISMAAAGLIFRPLTSPLSPSTTSPSFTHRRSIVSYSSRHLSSGGGGLSKCGDGYWSGGKVCCAAQQQRGYRKVRGRPNNARRKAKGKELELDVRICIEDQLPDDPEILQCFDLDSMLFDEAVGRLKAYEERIKGAEKMEDTQGGWLLASDRRSHECKH